MNVRWWRHGDLTFEPRQENAWEGTQKNELLAKQGYCVCITDDCDRAVMGLGVYPLWDGCGHAWATPSDAVRGKSLYVVRTALQCLYAICAAKGFHRVHTIIPRGLEENRKWITLLGFELEGVQRYACADKSDMLVYAKFYGDYYGEAQHTRARLQRNVVELFHMDAGFIGLPIP